MKVIIAVSLNPELNANYKKLASSNWTKDAEFTLVNVFHTHKYFLGTEDVPLAHPIETDIEEIKKSTINYLVRVRREVFGQIPENKIHYECLFSDDPKRAFCDYVNDRDFDLVVILTRKKRGFFESSFAQYVSRYANKAVLLLRETSEGD